MLTNACKRDKQRPILPIIPVVVRAGEKSVKILALLDSGSQVTLIRNDIARHLGISGKAERIRLSTFHGKDPELITNQIQFVVESEKENCFRAELQGLSVPHLHLTKSDVNWQVEKAKWGHLEDLDLPRTDTQPVLLLIGMDLAEAHAALEFRRPAPGCRGPFAMRTVFGWTVFGNHPASAHNYTSGTDPSLHCDTVA